MTELEYRGYTGTIEFSEEDHCFHGQINEAAPDTIRYSGSNLERLGSAFRDAVDNYVASNT